MTLMKQVMTPAHTGNGILTVRGFPSFNASMACSISWSSATAPPTVPITLPSRVTSIDEPRWRALDPSWPIIVTQANG
jgi:hypothetical protein